MVRQEWTKAKHPSGEALRKKTKKKNQSESEKAYSTGRLRKRARFVVKSEQLTKNPVLQKWA